jgi:hypothetical protein
VEEFGEGEWIYKCAPPYGNNNFLLNQRLQIRHKHYVTRDTQRVLLYVIVTNALDWRHSVDATLHLGPRFFEGWVSYDQVCDDHMLHEDKTKNGADIWVLS